MDDILTYDANWTETLSEFDLDILNYRQLGMDDEAEAMIAQRNALAAKHVAAGAAWLDQVKPGWELLVDVSTLNIDDPKSCICGQIFYLDALSLGVYYGITANHGEGWTLISNLSEKYADDEHWTENHGFVGGEHTEHWVRLIKDRLDQGVSL